MIHHSRWIFSGTENDEFCSPKSDPEADEPWTHPHEISLRPSASTCPRIAGASAFCWYANIVGFDPSIFCDFGLFPLWNRVQPFTVSAVPVALSMEVIKKNRGNPILTPKSSWIIHFHRIFHWASPIWQNLHITFPDVEALKRFESTDVSRRQVDAQTSGTEMSHRQAVRSCSCDG